MFNPPALLAALLKTEKLSLKQSGNVEVRIFPSTWLKQVTLPGVLRHMLNTPKDSTPQGRSDRANLEQGSDVKSSVSAVSALGMPCTYFLQKMVLLLTLFHFTSPLLTPHPLGIPSPRCARPFAVVQTFTLATGLSLWPCQWVMDVLPLVFMVSVPSRPCPAHEAVLAPPCISCGHPHTLHLV